MKRNRITIYFESLRGALKRPPPAIVNGTPRAAAETQRSGVARALIIIGVVVFVVIGGAIGGAYLWWLHYQDGPAYSLALLADAAQRDDRPAIDAVLDSDKVIDDFVSQLKQRGTGSDLSSITSALPPQLQPPTPELTPQMRQKVHDELVKELQRLTEAAAGKPFILVALAVSQFADIKQEDKVAHATVNIKDEELKLTMQSDVGRWRIVAVQDDKLAKKIYESVKRDLPSIGSQLKDAIQKKLDELKDRLPSTR
jgi:hypothetical protein